MTLQYDEDLFDETPEDDEAVAPIEGARPNIPSNPTLPPKRRLRIRAMTQSMASKHPEVVSIMLTRSNGQQLVFVRR